MDPNQAPRHRYRIRFSKSGLLRWISHRDLATLWERLMRRVKLDLAMTEGFHPKPKVSFPSALALGIEGLDEVVEIELRTPMDAADLRLRLQQDRQPGLDFGSVDAVPQNFGKAKLRETVYIVTLPDDETDDAANAKLEAFRGTESITVQRKKKTLTFLVAQQVKDLRIVDHSLRFCILAGGASTIRIPELLEAMGMGDYQARGSLFTRTRVRLHAEIPGTLDADDSPESLAPNDATSIADG
ncbi:MAG: TIGR03936 family radical SAM-associated protein [Planctomycetota bacterium]